MPIPPCRLLPLYRDFHPPALTLLAHKLQQVQLIIDHAALGLGPAEYNHLQVFNGCGAVCSSRRGHLLCALREDSGPVVVSAVVGKDVVGDAVVA